MLRAVLVQLALLHDNEIIPSLVLPLAQPLPSATERVSIITVLHRYVHHVIFRYIHPPFEVNMRLMRLIAYLRVLLLLPLHHRVSIQKHRILNPERVCVLIVKALEPSQFHSSQEFKPNRVDAPWPHCPVFLHLQLTEPVEYYFLRVSGRRHFELFVNVN